MIVLEYVLDMAMRQGFSSERLYTHSTPTGLKSIVFDSSYDDEPFDVAKPHITSFACINNRYTIQEATTLRSVIEHLHTSSVYQKIDEAMEQQNGLRGQRNLMTAGVKPLPLQYWFDPRGLDAVPKSVIGEYFDFDGIDCAAIANLDTLKSTRHLKYIDTISRLDVCLFCPIKIDDDKWYTHPVAHLRWESKKDVWNTYRLQVGRKYVIDSVLEMPSKAMGESDPRHMSDFFREVESWRNRYTSEEFTDNTIPF